MAMNVAAWYFSLSTSVSCNDSRVVPTRTICFCVIIFSDTRVSALNACWASNVGWNGWNSAPRALSLTAVAACPAGDAFSTSESGMPALAAASLQSLRPSFKRSRVVGAILASCASCSSAPATSAGTDCSAWLAELAAPASSFQARISRSRDWICSMDGSRPSRFLSSARRAFISDSAASGSSPGTPLRSPSSPRRYATPWSSIAKVRVRAS
eukprot:scaffold17679_cov98-Isochrysis_galbana.AAC.2